MARFLHHDFSCLRRKAPVLFLASFYLAGLISGILLFRQAEPSASLMRGAFPCAVSIVHLLSVSVLPFLFSAAAVYFSKPHLLYGIAFGKALTFSFVFAWATQAFAEAGWLARALLMFTDLGTMPLLLLYWLRHIPGARRFSGAEFGLLLVAVLFIGWMDCSCVVPFLGTV